ncbi:hypothetical protein [Streptomyces bauhiniae]|uniref:hypothetical protein n=1 Tax=Streptomyces bauhiniae TaxID=2340725 RepID=UPI0034558E76
MIEDIVTAALARMAEGSGAALIDLVRGYFSRNQESSQEMELLDRAEAGGLSPRDEQELRELLLRYADQDPAFRDQLQRGTTSVGASNSVSSSVVQKLIQAQNVGDVTM